MNKHRKKCEHLKAIRKNMADSLGVELEQTVCTYEGDCGGTCPKCKSEEQKLSKALLKSAAVAATTTMLLTGCAENTILDDVGDYIEDFIDESLGSDELTGALPAIK